MKTRLFVMMSLIAALTRFASAFEGEAVSVPAQVSHDAWDGLVKKYVNERGLVAYADWKNNKADIDAPTKPRSITAQRLKPFADDDGHNCQDAAASSDHECGMPLPIQSVRSTAAQAQIEPPLPVIEPSRHVTIWINRRE